MFNDADESVREASIVSMTSLDLNVSGKYSRNIPIPYSDRPAICLGRKGDPRALNPLGNSLASQPDEDEDVRAAAASALGELLKPEAEEPLSQALANDQSPTVREASAEALGALGNPALPNPWSRRWLTMQREDVRESAADALGELLNPDSLPALLKDVRMIPLPK